MTVDPLILAVIGLILFIAGLWIFAPAVIVNMLIGLMRRASGLKRKSKKVDGWTWTYLEGGKKHPQTLVMIHGFGGDKDNWTAYAKSFTKKYHVIIPDLPGFGEQDRRAGEDYSMSTQSKRLDAFLKAIGVESCHLAGNSMGGYIALTHAIERPKRVASLTLLNNAGVRGEQKSEVEVAVEQGKNLLKFDTYEEMEQLMAFITHQPLEYPRKIKQVKYKEALQWQPFQDQLFWKMVTVMQQKPLNDHLHKVDCPTFVIWGQHDRVIDVSCVAAITTGITHAQSVVMDDMGHVPMLENPEKTADHHLGFLKRLP